MLDEMKNGWLIKKVYFFIKILKLNMDNHFEC